MAQNPEWSLEEIQQELITMPKISSGYVVRWVKNKELVVPKYRDISFQCGLMEDCVLH